MKVAERVLIVRPGALGDLVLTLPAIQQIRALHPGAHITLAANAQFFAVALPTVDRLLDFDSREMLQIISGSSGVLYSDAYVWLRNPADPIVQNLRAAGARVVYLPSFQEHEAIPQSEFLQHGIPGSRGAKPRIIFTPAEREMAEPRPDTIALHPGAGSAGKRWPLVSFLEAAFELEARKFRILWIQGPAEESMQLPGETLQSPSLRALALVLSAVAGFLGNDSGITHLAGASGCPSLALFGPTNPAVWASTEFIYTPGPLPSASVQDVLDRLIRSMHHKQE
jgi:heptosyltransferase-3